MIQVFTRRVLQPINPYTPLEEGSSNRSQQDSTSVNPHTPLKAQERKFVQQKYKVKNPKKEQQKALMVEEPDNWRRPFIDYFKEGKLPTEKSLATQMSKKILRYAYVNDTLYRRSKL